MAFSSGVEGVNERSLEAVKDASFFLTTLTSEISGLGVLSGWQGNR